MPRYPRQWSSTQIYHVMIKGINKEYIFKLDRHKTKFINIIVDIKKEFEFEVIAYCIMDNHVHLLLRVNNGQLLALIMKKINLKYALYYNKIENRNGHLFQNRFRSEAIEDERYLICALAYVHNNPVKACIVDKAQNYKWSSLQEYNGVVKNLINDSTIIGIIEMLNGIDNFTKLHENDVENVFIDLKEDEESTRNEIASKIISEFYGLNNINNLNKVDNQEKGILIKKLLDIKSITNIKIADLLKISRNTVNEVKRGINKEI